MRTKIDIKKDPNDWTLEDAAAQFDSIEASIQWRRAYGHPFGMVGVITRSLLATWEATSGTLTTKRRRELGALVKTLEAEWFEMRGLPVLARSHEQRGMLVISAWAIRMLKAAITKSPAKKKPV